MSDYISKATAKKLLCFDAGGLCCMSQALMVKEIVARYQDGQDNSAPLKIKDCFDMIGGSGFGGLLAIMAGILEMTADQLVLEFCSLCNAIFAYESTVAERTQRVEGAVKELVGKYSKDRGGETRTMRSGQDSCKVFVCTSSCSNLALPRILRNYVVCANQTPDCAVWEAACASLAIPGLLEPVNIGSKFLSEPILTGEVRWGNPTRYLAREAATAFPDSHVACILSIGSGHPRILSISNTLENLFHDISTDCQVHADEMDERFGDVPRLYWRLEVKQGLQNLKDSKDIAAFSSIVASTSSHIQMNATSQTIDGLVKVLRAPQKRVLASTITGKVLVTAHTVRLRQCPNPTLYFTGQAKILKEMDEYFISSRNGCRVGVLYGVGGSGKTQIGLMFVQRSQAVHRFTEVFFIDASNIDTLRGDFETLARAMSSGTTLEAGQRYLSSRCDNWLLFLDNADDPNLDLRPFVSWPCGNVLVTTRNQAVRAHAPDCRIQVTSFTIDDSIELLLHGLDTREDEATKAAAVEIVTALGCLPLAISHARAYLDQGSCNLPNYLKLYKSNPNLLLQKLPVPSTDDYEHSVYSTFVLSFNQLSERAVLFLQLLCFLHHEDIPSNIVEAAQKKFCGNSEYYAGCLPPIVVQFLSDLSCKTRSWNADRFYLLVNEVLSFSLILSDVVNNSFTFHPLVQKLLQTLFKPHAELITASQSLLSLAIPISSDSDDYPTRRRFIPHIRSAEMHGLNVSHDLLNGFALSYLEDGKNHHASKIWRKEYEAKKCLLGPEHRETLRSLTDLATSYRRLGHLADALQEDEHVLAIRKRVLGEEDPETLRSMSNIVTSYTVLGRFVDALQLNKRLFDVRKRVLGERHPDTLWNMHNLGISYIQQGCFAEASSLLEKALELRKQVLGLEHYETIRSMNRLAEAYRGLGRYIDALWLDEHVLSMALKRLPEEHPDTLWSKNSLSDSYKELGRFAEATALYEHVVELRVKVLYPDHPETLRSISNLAASYRDLGRSADALQLDQQVLDARKQALGPEHPDTITSINNLAASHRDLGHFEIALLLDRQALEMRKRLLGDDHPETLTSMNNLAASYRGINNLADALSLNKQALELRQRVLGQEHPHTLSSMGDLALTYEKMGSAYDARPLFEKVLETRKQVLGLHHPHTLGSERLYAEFQQRSQKRFFWMFAYFWRPNSKNSSNNTPAHPPRLVDFGRISNFFLSFFVLVVVMILYAHN
ncbi:hypothetical protein DL96DRAFT_1824366 [Flagelloscypha sp. PMI_526]|nr:hypothetical protein DL96DRAFT_1824366 [Flagelloscypha sp. PMI_526]